MTSYQPESYEQIKEIHRLAEVIHRTIETQGWECYHPSPTLLSCIGIARVVLKEVKNK